MKRIDFLRTVWPATGHYCIATPHINLAGKPGYKHHIEDTIGLASGYAKSIAASKDAYFGIFTHINAEVYSPASGRSWPSRKRENMSHAKTLFLDLDVGKKANTYPSQADALSALAKLVFLTGLPAPFTVSSGNGVHVYWPFTDPMDVATWKPMATMLRQLLDHHKVIYDPSRTLDTTSVLRVPGTFNHKDPSNLKPVEVLHIGDVSDNDALNTQLTFLTAGLQPLKVGVAYANIPGVTNYNVVGNISPHGVGFPPTDVNDVASECAQIAMFRDTTGNISEPHWYAALGVVGFCKDGIKWAHQWSSGHPNYTHAETQAKIDQWQLNGSVTSCAKLATDGAPGLCQKCPHFNSIHKNPVVITNKKPLVAAKQQAALMAPAPATAPITPPTIMCPLEVCDPPWPYTRTQSLTTSRDTGKIPVPVLDGYDLYPISVSSGRYQFSETTSKGISTWVARWRDEQTGNIAWTQFDMLTELLATPAELNKRLFNECVHVANAPEVAGYMSAYLKQLHASVGSTKVYGFTGWPGHNKYDRFVLNKKVVNAQGQISPCLMAPQCEIATAGMTQEGSLQGQINALKFYSDQSAYAAHQFLILCSLGTPLFIATGHNGAVINAYGKSGASKSTALKAAGGIWGDPSKFVVNGTTRGITSLARDKRAEIIPNLPTLVDEITQMEPEDARAMVMGQTQAIGRISLTGERVVREGKTSAFRSALLITTSNRSLHQMVNTNAQAGTANTARVLELIFDPAKMAHTKDQADKAKKLLDENYGWLGERFMQLAMPTMEHLMDSVQRMVSKLNRDMGVSSVERFYVAAAAPALVAGAFAAYHGLIDWDMDALYDWFVNSQFVQARGVLASETKRFSYENALRNFLDNYVLDTIEDDGTGNIPPANLHVQVVIHRRTDKREIWVHASKLREYCDRNQVSYDTMLHELKERGAVLVKSARRKLGEGTRYALTRTTVVILNLDSPLLT